MLLFFDSLSKVKMVSIGLMVAEGLRNTLSPTLRLEMC